MNSLVIFFNFLNQLDHYEVSIRKQKTGKICNSSIAFCFIKETIKRILLFGFWSFKS